MLIPITALVLILMTVAMLLLRIFWLRVPSRLRFFLIRLSLIGRADPDSETGTET